MSFAIVTERHPGGTAADGHAIAAGSLYPSTQTYRSGLSSRAAPDDRKSRVRVRLTRLGRPRGRPMYFATVVAAFSPTPLGGRRGIRTPGTREGPSVFKTGAFVRSAILPSLIVGAASNRPESVARRTGRVRADDGVRLFRRRGTAWPPGRRGPCPPRGPPGSPAWRPRRATRRASSPGSPAPGRCLRARSGRTPTPPHRR